LIHFSIRIWQDQHITSQ
jgi:hypothetical protein